MTFGQKSSRLNSRPVYCFDFTVISFKYFVVVLYLKTVMDSKLANSTKVFSILSHLQQVNENSVLHNFCLSTCYILTNSNFINSYGDGIILKITIGILGSNADLGRNWDVWETAVACIKAVDYYSGNQNFCILKSQLPICCIFFL